MYPDSLREYITKSNQIKANLNSEAAYKLQGIHCSLRTMWKLEAEEGSGDTYQSTIRGNKSTISIRQGAEQSWKQELFVEKAASTPEDVFEESLHTSLSKISKKLPGIKMRRVDSGWQITTPKELREDHEDHFTKVIRKYIDFLKGEEMPAWEVPNMLAKYYTTIKASVCK